MVVTVTYEGVPIVKGAPAQTEAGDRLFIPCEFPMPVGTAVQVELDHASRRFAQVVRVSEGGEGGQGAGMALEWRAGEPMRMAPAPRAPSGATADPASPAATAAASAPVPEPVPAPTEPSSGGRAGRRRRRR